MPIDDKLHGLSARYAAAPQWVKTVVGGAYGLIPPRQRHGPSYERFSRVFGEPGADPGYAQRRLAETLESALAGVPAYAAHGRLLRHLEADPAEVLRELPLTRKEDIKHDPQAFLSHRHPASDRLKMFTGGSTDVPLTFHVHRGVSRAKEWAVFDAMGKRFGTEGPGVTLALRGRTVPTANNGRMWMYEPIKRQLVLSSDHLEVRFMPQYAEAIKRWRPRYIHAFPSALHPLLVWLRDSGQQGLLSQVSCVTLTSESVFDDQLKAFKEFFDCPVVVTYGHSERVLLANTLPDDGRYHFWPQYGHLELLDASGRAVTTPGHMGEIVGTSFDNLVMPFVRYRTGDYAVLGEKPHASATGFPVLERIEGRLQEFVVCHDHRLVTVTTLGAAHFERLDRCLRIQYEQHEPGMLTLRVVSIGRLDAAATREIEAAVARKTQGGCRVRVEQVESIGLTPTGKQRLLIQHLPVDRYLGATMNTIGSFPAVSPVASPPHPPPASSPASSPAIWPAHPPSPALQLPQGKAVVMLGTDMLTRGGIAAVISTYQSGGLFDRLPVVHIATHQDGHKLVKALRFAHSAATFAHALALRRVALVHAHVSSRASLRRKSLLLTLARALGVPTVFHLHSSGFAGWVAADRTGLRAWWIRRTLERSDTVIVLTNTWAEWVRHFAPSARVQVLGNPVALPAPAAQACDRASHAGGGRVLFLGWIYDFKGVYDLLQAWARFRVACPGWRLAVGGKGEVDRFLAEAERLGVREDIDFLGWVSGPEKDRQLRQADILVLPSYAEGMPVSVLEAMAYGVAVATTPVGGVPDIMEPDVHGLWMPPGDINGITDRLVQLAQSPELRRRLTDAALERVSRDSSVDAVLNRLLTLYAQALR